MNIIFFDDWQSTLIVYRGQLLHNVMKKERIAVDEVWAALREKAPKWQLPMDL